MEEINTKLIRSKLTERQDLKDIKNSLFFIDNKLMTRSIDISKLFKKRHNIIIEDISSIINQDLGFFKNFKKDIGFVKFNVEEEVVEIFESDTDEFGVEILEAEKIDIYYIDWIFWGVLVNGYISKRACKIKALWIETMMTLIHINQKQEWLCMNSGVQAEESDLGKLLYSLSEKMDHLILENTKFMKANKRRELTKEEKLYKEIKIKKIKDKVSAEARLKLADVRNRVIQSQKDHGLVYDMNEIYEKEKLIEIENEKKRMALFGNMTEDNIINKTNKISDTNRVRINTEEIEIDDDMAEKLVPRDKALSNKKINYKTGVTIDEDVWTKEVKDTIKKLNKELLILYRNKLNTYSSKNNQSHYVTKEENILYKRLCSLYDMINLKHMKSNSYGEYINRTALMIDDVL